MKIDAVKLIYILVTFAVCIGIVVSDRVSRKNKEEKIETICVESPDSKLTMVAMRCHKMEQDNDMLRLRIEELEDAIYSMTNNPPAKEIRFRIVGAVDDLIDSQDLDKSLCGQYYLWNSTNNLQNE